MELEWSLLDPPSRHLAEWLDRVLAAGMVEFGKSGRAYGRDEIIEALVTETPSNVARFKIVEPTLTELAADVALLTYRLEPRVQGGSEFQVASLRSSIWRKREGRWQLLFHQGTAAA